MGENYSYRKGNGLANFMKFFIIIILKNDRKLITWKRKRLNKFYEIPAIILKK